MFCIDRSANRISKLAQVRFSDLGFSERGHLQEWLANQPEELGEELLIIQKEFDGFDDTRERLDLLALDKQGGLVIIENKLDDSGRDVVWQALKYASYCSTLSKTQIAEVFQHYLDRTGSGGNSRDLICDFLEEESFEEVVLNSGNEQRLILVAAQFRKEVTSTVLWLLHHGIRLQCFKATPFQHRDLLLLNLEQVIPLPEAEELMIGISEKEKEELIAERGQARRHTLRMEFWHKTLDALEKAGEELYQNVGPSDAHWLNAGAGLSGTHYALIFSKDEARVEFVLGRTKDENKLLFDHLYLRHNEFDKTFGADLQWRRLDKRKVSMIVYSKPFDGYERENWPAMIEWLVENIRRMKATFSPEIGNLRQLLQNRPNSPRPERVPSKDESHLQIV